MLTTILLLIFLGIATATDVTRQKIYNWTVYPGILSAIALNAFATLFAASDRVDVPTLQNLGTIGLATSVLGLITCGFAMIVCYVFFQVGGGDVKMIAMMGAFLGPEHGVEAMLWTFVLGGCAGVMVLVWRMGGLQLVRAVGRQLFWVLRVGHRGPLSEEELAALQPPLFLAPCALGAAAIVQSGIFAPG